MFLNIALVFSDIAKIYICDILQVLWVSGKPFAGENIKKLREIYRRHQMRFFIRRKTEEIF